MLGQKYFNSPILIPIITFLFKIVNEYQNGTLYLHVHILFDPLHMLLE